jgi:hypothetical protein
MGILDPLLWEDVLPQVWVHADFLPAMLRAGFLPAELQPHLAAQ